MAPSRGITSGDPVNHVLEVTVTATGGTITPPCDVTVDLRDQLGPGLTYTGSSTGGTCTTPAGGNPVQCTVTFTHITTGGSSETIIIRTTAGDAPPPGYCDIAQADAQLPAVGGDLDQACAQAEDVPPPPANGGGGDTDEFDEGFGFGGGFGGFGTGFSTASTPLGGVDTGAGGTAGSNAAVPQLALASLLTIGFLLFGLRRLRRA